VAAVVLVVPDSGAGADLVLELREVAYTGVASPAGHDEDAREVDGLGVGRRRSGGIARWQLAGQGDVAAERLDQGRAPAGVAPVPCPEGGDVGGLGEHAEDCLATIAAGQPVVALLGLEHLGKVADVVLGAMMGMNSRS